ncbi:MAG TPA: hypothetical protein VIX84_11605 [Acidimicrobiales bacterium]
MSWSSGKDSTLALHRLKTEGKLDVVALLTTVNTEADRVAMHGVRRALLEAQAAMLDLPVHVVELPWPCPNEVYEERMADALDLAHAAGVEAIVFGDLFLEEVRRYREDALRDTGLHPVFPLWQRPTPEIAQELLAFGVRALITCVDVAQAPREITGRWYDQTLLDELPDTVDPCGENGEFHTVVVDGPGFSEPIQVDRGETVERDGFVFVDVIPAHPPR